MKGARMKESLAHSVWECKYHIVWVPKKRQKVIFGRLRKEIGVVLRRLCEYKGVKLLEGKACLDHIHIFLAIPPKYSVSTIVGYLKGKSAMILFEKFTNLKRNFKGHSFWARGYYVNTVGLDEAKVRKYIQDQEENEAMEDRYTPIGNPFEESIPLFFPKEILP